MESENDKENMTDQYLRDIILSFLIAGKDSSANTLAWFFYMLCKHPLIQEKVVNEVKLATEVTDQLSTDGFVRKLSDPILDRMQYLHAALTETLRLYPAVPVVIFFISSYPLPLSFTTTKRLLGFEVPYMHELTNWSTLVFS